MKHWFLCALLAVSVPSIAAADSIELVSGVAPTITTSIVAGGTYTTGTNPLNFFNGWEITVNGSSSSPGLSPYGLDLQVLATCVSGNCLTMPLDVFFTDTGFNVSVPAGGFQTTYSATDTGEGATRAITWADSTDTLFGGGLPTGVGADHLGTVGPFSGSGGFGTASGGPAEGPTAYSLTIEDIFTAGPSGTSSFSTDGNITATVPEPSSLALLASGLLVMILLKRRRQTIGA
jgi:PEP-CTERM motif